MSKSVLISIKPEYCQLIAHSCKTIEVRKNRPKIETPFKVYIYCSKGEGYSPDVTQGMVIGEFLCKQTDMYPNYQNYPNAYPIGEGLLCAMACLDKNELYNYLQGATPYAWHISDLVIYEVPKELSTFGKSKPPQSWYYINEEGSSK